MLTNASVNSGNRGQHSGARGHHRAQTARDHKGHRARPAGYRGQHTGPRRHKAIPGGHGKRLVVVIATLAGILASIAMAVDFASDEPMFPGLTTIDFPRCPARTETWQGTQDRELYEENSGGTWVLDGAVWKGQTYPVRSESWRRGCIKGGEVRGPIPKTATRDEWYDEAAGREVSGEGLRVTMTDSPANWLLVEDMYMDDVEDAYDPNAANHAARTYLNHVHAEFVRDDCIENEDPVHNVYVNNSFFDGCFAAFAQRPPGSESARNGETPADFVVENSLVHIRPQPLGSNYCGESSVSRGRCLRTSGHWLGAYGIWKWSDEAAAHVEVRNTIFRLDMPSYSSCRAQEWPEGTYENVTLVWTGSGQYRSAGECTNTVPEGVMVTSEQSVWDEAVTDWLNQ